MFRRISIFLAALAVSAVTFASAQADLQSSFDAGYHLYQDAEYKKAAEALSKVNSQLDDKTPPDLAVQVKLFLAAALFTNGDPTAKDVFLQLCRVDPSYKIDKKKFKQGIVDTFDKAKNQCDSELSVLCSERVAIVTGAISRGDPVEIAGAAESLGPQCDRDNRQHAKAAQAVFDIAMKNLDEHAGAAKAQFEIAVRLDKEIAKKVPSSGTIRVTVGVPGGQLFIGNILLKRMGSTQEAETQEFPFRPGNHKLRLEPAGGYDVQEKEVILTTNAVEQVAFIPSRKVEVTANSPTRPESDRKEISLANGDGFDFDSGKLLNGQDDFTGADVEWIAGRLISWDQAQFSDPLSISYEDQIESTVLKRYQYFSGRSIPVDKTTTIGIRTIDGNFVVAQVSKSTSVSSAITIRWRIYH